MFPIFTIVSRTYKSYLTVLAIVLTIGLLSEIGISFGTSTIFGVSSIGFEASFFVSEITFFVATGFFTTAFLIGLAFSFTNAIPHFGHFPGLGE